VPTYIIFNLILIAGLLGTLLLVDLLSGCSKNLATLSTAEHSVDHCSPLRSGVYTQQELINIGLNQTPN
jgi:hypothetical protein